MKVYVFVVNCYLLGGTECLSNAFRARGHAVPVSWHIDAKPPVQLELF